MMPTAKPARLPRWLLGLALLALIGMAMFWRDRWNATALRSAVDAAGSAGPLLFIAIYALACVLFLPGVVITLAGGLLFGPVWGALWNLTGATLGAAMAFLIARHLGAGWAARRAGPGLTRLNQGVADEGWRFVALVRLMPLFPFNVMNFALGLTPIRFSTYVLASAVFMPPGALAYSWLGHAGGQALSGNGQMLRHLPMALALVAALVFLPRLVRALRPAAHPAFPKPLETDAAND